MPNLFIDVSARFAQVQDALEQISRKVTGAAGQMDKAFGAVKKTLATLGVTLTVGAITAFIKNSIDAADHLNDLSKKTGIAVETLGGLGFAAQQSGGDLDTMSDAIGKLNRSIAEAGAGNREKADAFKALGVSVRDASGQLKSADQIMIELADKFAGYEDGPNKVALAIKLFGKAGADIIPTLNEGGAKIRENIEYYKRYSGVTKDVAERADQFNDTLTKLKLLSGALGTQIASGLLDPLQKLADRLLQLKENSQLFETAAEGVKLVLAGWISIGAGGAFVFEAIGRRLGALAAQAEAVKRGDIKGALEIGREASADIDAARASMEKYVASLFKAQSVADREDAEFGRFRLPGRARPQAPGLPDTGAAAQADAARKAAAALTEARSKIIVEGEKAASATRLAVLDHFYKEGFAGEERYWQVRGEIQRAAYEVERRALDENVTSRQVALNDATRLKGKGSKEYFDALKDLAEAQAKRNTLDAGFNAQGVTDVLARAKATADYERAIKNVNIQLEQLKGNTAAAAAAQFELQNEQLRRQAEARGDTAGQEALDNLGRANAAQARFNELRERAAEITDRLALEEERIQNSQRTGAISEFEALRRTDAARRLALQSLALTQQQLDDIARGSGLDSQALAADRFRVSLESLAASANLVGDRVKRTFEDAFTDEFAKVIDGTQKVSDAFKNMGRSILAEVSRIQARNIAQAIAGSVSGGGGGFLDSVFKGVFGGNTSSSLGYGTVSEYLPVNGPYAMGTDFVPSTGLAWLERGEKVIPVGENAAGVTVINNNDFRNVGAAEIAQIRRELAIVERSTASRVEDAQRRKR